MKLEFSNLKKGMMIVDDDDGDGPLYGKIEDCSDIHNVYVKYDGGGYGLLCMEETCDEYDGPHQIYEMSQEVKVKRAIKMLIKRLVMTV